METVWSVERTMVDGDATLWTTFGLLKSVSVCAQLSRPEWLSTLASETTAHGSMHFACNLILNPIRNQFGFASIELSQRVCPPTCLSHSCVSVDWANINRRVNVCTRMKPRTRSFCCYYKNWSACDGEKNRTVLWHRWPTVPHGSN